MKIVKTMSILAAAIVLMFIFLRLALITAPWYVTQNELNNAFEDYVLTSERAAEAERLSIEFPSASNDFFFKTETENLKKVQKTLSSKVQYCINENRSRCDYLKFVEKYGNYENE